MSELAGVNCLRSDFRGRRRERIQASPQFDGKVFRNRLANMTTFSGRQLSVLGELFFGNNERSPRSPLPADRPLEAWKRNPDTGLRITWLGHSSSLIEIDGHRVLIDPVFAERASPLKMAGPKRFQPAPVTVAELPEFDAILLSHDHYDHLCIATLRELAPRGVPIVTSLGVGERLEPLGFAPELIRELDWGEHTDIRGLRITAAPAQHFSGRAFRDRNRTLWSSWVVQGPKHKIYFSGDSGFADHFASIGKMHGPFDVALIEIGAFHQSWENVHLGPTNALKAFQMVNAAAMLPVHWGTFSLATHDWDEPPETLLKLATEQHARLLLPRLGQAVEPSRIDAPEAWWRSSTFGHEPRQ